MNVEIMKRPPRTMMEVYKSLPEGTLAQLIENNLVMSPAPSFNHQDILMDILFPIQNYTRKNDLGKVIVAPVDVYFGRKNVFQPDIIFISNNKLNLIRKDGFHGAPDLIIEILSPRTATYDLGKKKDIYEHYGVKEYWIIAPETKKVTGYFLEEVFEEIAAGNGEIPSELLKHTFRF